MRTQPHSLGQNSQWPPRCECPRCDGWGTVACRTGGDICFGDAGGGRTCPACNGTGFARSARAAAGQRESE